MTHKTFISTSYIRKAYRDYEFKPLCVYGPLGYGKSVYAIKALLQVYFYDRYEDKTMKQLIKRESKIPFNQLEDKSIIIKTIKEHMLYTPQQFITKIKTMHEHHDRELLLILDDAGIWLDSLNWNDPFVKSVSEYMQMARTDWGSIMFTAPLPICITKKIRSLPDMMNGQIRKISGSSYIIKGKRYREWRRVIRWYDCYLLPDMHKTKIKGGKKKEDYFSLKLSNYIWFWYKNLREKMTEVASRKMRKRLPSFVD